MVEMNRICAPDRHNQIDDMITPEELVESSAARLEYTAREQKKAEEFIRNRTQAYVEEISSHLRDPSLRCPSIAKSTFVVCKASLPHLDKEKEVFYIGKRNNVYMWVESMRLVMKEFQNLGFATQFDEVNSGFFLWVE